MDITPDEARQIVDLVGAVEALNVPFVEPADRALRDKCRAFLAQCFRCPHCDGSDCSHGWKNEIEPKNIVTPRPMSTAPKDGTVILAFIDGTDYAQPVRIVRGYGTHCTIVGWHMAWDGTAIRESDLLGWLPAPVYSGPSVR